MSAEIPGTELFDTQNYLGLLKNAAEGKDQLDFSEAPPIGDFLQLSIIEDEHRFTGNFKPLDYEGHQWELELTSSISAQVDVQITLLETGNLQDSSKLYILDKDYNCLIPANEGQFDVQLRKGLPVRHLRVLIGTKGFAEEHSEGIPLVPLDYVLEQNYPNPFNPETTIRYQLGKRSRVVVEIYNMLGGKIRTLVNENKNTGSHSVAWNGMNEAGRPVAGGVYFYRIKADEFTAAKKMVLIR